MTLESKRTAHAVSVSMSGKREQVLTSLVSASSVHETGRPVKGRQGFDEHKARQMADMMTSSQRRDILLAARAIQETERNKDGVFDRFRTQRPADWITPGQQRDILLLACVIQEGGQQQL